MSIKLEKTNDKKVGFFYFKQLNGQYLLTNFIGEYCFLNLHQFELFLAGKIKQKYPTKFTELENKNFFKDRLNLTSICNKFAFRKRFLGFGTILHIVVVTLKCDHTCIYCQTSSQDSSSRRFDMDIETAKKVVDRIFESPSRSITIEFQGGEPLLNFDTVKFITDYAHEKNKKAKKNLFISLVSNFVSMDKKKFAYLIDKQVNMCTSIDGPKWLHNKNRIYHGRKNSYQATIRWFKKIKELYDKKKYPHKPGILTTLTQGSFPYYKEIVDLFLRFGCEFIHLRQTSPLGFAKKTWKDIGYTPEEFGQFYKNSLDYIIELNLKGKRICERTAYIFLRKILCGDEPLYLDLMSPCGAGIGQLAYNFNGDVYACDEARMLSQMGDASFKLGNVSQSYEEFLKKDVVKSLAISSTLENLPGCSNCVYNPYCGVCPIYNYVEKGNIFGQEPHNSRCKINMFILDYLFQRLKDRKIYNVFHSWTRLDLS